MSTQKTLKIPKTITLQIEIPLIRRHHRFLVANGDTYFIGARGSLEDMTIEYNLYEVDNYGNHVFDGGYDSLEKLSTAVYDFLGIYEVFHVDNTEIIFGT